MFVRFILTIVLFKSSISLLIFSLDVLSTIESGELKSTNILECKCNFAWHLFLLRICGKIWEKM